MILVGWFICNEQRCAWVIRLADIETDVCAWAIRCDLMFCCTVCCSDIALDVDFGFWWMLRSCFVVALCVPMISDGVGCDVLSVIFLCIVWYFFVFIFMLFLCLFDFWCYLDFMFFCWFVGFVLTVLILMCIACRFVVFVVCGWTTLGQFWLICPFCPFKRTPLLTYANNPKNLAFAEDNIYTMGLSFCAP